MNLPICKLKYQRDAQTEIVVFKVKIIEHKDFEYCCKINVVISIGVVGKIFLILNIIIDFNTVITTYFQQTIFSKKQYLLH